MSVPRAIESWHRVMSEGDLAALDDLLADDVVFHSPVVHTPQEGKAVTKLYLSAAANVFSGEGKFSYVREIYGERDAVLEFLVELDGIVVNGVDLIQWIGQVGPVTAQARNLPRASACSPSSKAKLRSLEAIR